jgi:hypothetical protein
MTTHENVNRRYADLQALLCEAFQAQGRGLVEMTLSIQDQLPKSLVWELRSIGHIRNQVVHENLAKVPKYFEPLCKEALATLKQLRRERKPSKTRQGAIRSTAAVTPVTAVARSKVQAKAAKAVKGAPKKKTAKSSSGRKPSPRSR